MSQSPAPDGFITDAEWLSDRLARAQKRAAKAEIALAGSSENTIRWHDAERRLRFALEEVEAYEESLREVS